MEGIKVWDPLSGLQSKFSLLYLSFLLRSSYPIWLSKVGPMWDEST